MPAIRGVSHIELSVRDAEQSAAMIRGVLDGAKGAARDIVVLNAGAAIYAADRAPSIAEGMRVASETIDGGGARTLLARVAAQSHAGPNS